MKSLVQWLIMRRLFLTQINILALAISQLEYNKMGWKRWIFLKSFQVIFPTSIEKHCIKAVLELEVQWHASVHHVWYQLPSLVARVLEITIPDFGPT